MRTPINIFDIPGIKRLHSILPLYCRNAHAVIVCYDITSQRSFDEVEFWSSVRTMAADDAVLVLVGCKSDLEDKREVPVAKGEEMAVSLSRSGENVLFFETSSKLQRNVYQVFERVISDVMKSRRETVSKDDCIRLDPPLLESPHKHSCV